MSLRSVPLPRHVRCSVRACTSSVRHPRTPRTHASTSALHAQRPYATITPSILEPRPPPPPPPLPSDILSGGENRPLAPDAPPPPDAPDSLNARILHYVREERGGISLPSLLAQYDDRAGDVLPSALKYEPSPPAERRVWFSDRAAPGVVAIVHATGEGIVKVCSGFAVEPTRAEDGGGQLFVTCAHTLEEMRRAPVGAKSGTFVLASDGEGNLVVHRVTSIPSALPRSDVMLLRATPPRDASQPALASSFESGIESSPTLHGAGASTSGERICSGAPVPHASGPLFRHVASPSAVSTTAPRVPTLPVNPYPLHPGARVRAHFVRDKLSPVDEEGWTPWIGGGWSKWVRGEVLGYRDFAGKEAKPGTYDALSHLLFEPLPTPGSSGGPIVDEESGAVVGVVLGTRMDSARIDGMRGWGVPSETILEMFSLPGLEGKR